METDNHIVKYKGQIRKCAINILAWIENNPNPTEEKVNELRQLKGKLNDVVFNFCENIKDWEKRTTTLPLNEDKLDEQKQFLEEQQFVEGSGN